MKLMTRRLSALSAVAAAALAAIPYSAQAQELSLAGKTVEFVIPFAESGGSARWANFFAPLLSQTLPGNPTVVVRYRPGGGSTTGANWFQEQSNGDGTILFGPSGSTQFPYLLGDPRVRYEYDDWKVVLASGTGGVAYLPRDLADKWNGTADNLQDEIFLYGSQGATTLDLVPLLAFKLLGLDVDPVFGVEGRGDGRLMFERGEANIDYQTSSAYIRSVQPMVDQGIAVPMFSWGSLDGAGNIVRDPTFPDLPSFKEVCEATAACKTEGTAWDAYKAFFIAGFAAQKMVYLPGTASQEVVDMYTKAFDDLLALPNFAEISAAELGVYPQMTGASAVTASELATTVSPEAKKFVLDWLRDDYGITMN